MFITATFQTDVFQCIWKYKKPPCKKITGRNKLGKCVISNDDIIADFSNNVKEEFMKKCVFYGRYSSVMQNEQSIEGQLHVCRQYAEQNGLEIVGEYIEM